MAIKYVCDSCGNDIENFNERSHLYILPRRVKYYAKSQDIKLAEYVKIENKETHLCTQCIQILAESLKAMPV